MLYSSIVIDFQVFKSDIICSLPKFLMSSAPFCFFFIPPDDTGLISTVEHVSRTPVSP